MKQSFVTAPDGVRLAIYQGGNPAGPEILFIHGFSQCALCWRSLFESADLSSRFRLTAFDIRGHGDSDKPTEPGFYADDRIFAEDIRTVMEALSLRRPVLVAWSYAGRLVSDFVSAFGTDRLAGINFVCARTRNHPDFDGPGRIFISTMIRDDPAGAAEATRAFVGECFALAPAADVLEAIYDYNMKVPAVVRSHHIRRPLSEGAIWSTVDVPVLVTQGSEDRLVLKELAEWTASTIPGAELSVYEGVGHTPFMEDRPRFERELAEFVTRAAAAGETRGARRCRPDIESA